MQQLVMWPPGSKKVGQSKGHWGPVCARWEDFTATAQTTLGSFFSLFFFIRGRGVKWERKRPLRRVKLHSREFTGQDSSG